MQIPLRGRDPREGAPVQSVLFVRGVAHGGQISKPKLKLVCACQKGGVDSGSRDR